jgi:methionyl-tRNA formyltransferase
VRIFLNGIGSFGADVFERLRKDGEEVVAVAAPALSLSGRPDRLFDAAVKAGIQAFDGGELDKPENEAALRALEPELGIMAFVQKKISKVILDLPEHGTIQYHPSLLPRHRGRSSINWAIILGEQETGVSIYWPDEGLDTGPVLLQRKADIGPEDTAGSLYYEKLYPLGIDMLAEAARLVAAGTAPKLVQDEAAATYERPCQGVAARIDWHRPLVQVFNHIRGCDPSPGASTQWQGQVVRLLQARQVPDFVASPGVVAALDERGLVVGTEGGAIAVGKLQVGSSPAADAVQVAGELGISVGDSFSGAAE